MQAMETGPMVSDLEQRARLLRSRIILNSHRTGTPHLGGCLSSVDILTALYFDVLRIDPARPQDPDRDRFILSKGHGVPALFQVLAMRGYFDPGLMSDYGQDGSLFGEHPPIPGKLPGIEAATGSLGHGFPMGVGMAMAGRLQQRSFKTYMLLGDGECNEGSIWEAAMLAAAQSLTRLVAIVDYNKWQGTGASNDILALAPLADKWRAFGWHAIEVDGHSMADLRGLLSQPLEQIGKPVAIIAHTVKGKGAPFMEDDNNWHYRIPTQEEVIAADQALGLA